MRIPPKERAGSISEACVSGSGSAEVKSEIHSQTDRRGKEAPGRNCPTCQAVWALRLSQDYSPTQKTGLAGQSQAGGTYLASGGAEGSPKAAQTRTSLAQRWVLCQAQAHASPQRLVVRFCGRPHSRWSLN